MNNHIFNSVKALCNPIIQQKSFYLFKLIEDWSIIVSNDIATNCAPIKLQFNAKNQAVLTIKVKNSVLLVNMLHQKANILLSVNKYLGFNCVKDIKFIN